MMKAVAKTPVASNAVFIGAAPAGE
jgi:hypothetical protein